MTTKYVSTKTYEVLERKAACFYWRGQYFSGLIDVKANALYDDPENSFAAVVGVPSSIEKRLIAVLGPNVESHPLK
jgi:hypothetical protein